MEWRGRHGSHAEGIMSSVQGPTRPTPPPAPPKPQPVKSETREATSNSPVEAAKRQPAPPKAEPTSNSPKKVGGRLDVTA